MSTQIKYMPKKKVMSSEDVKKYRGFKEECLKQLAEEKSGKNKQSEKKDVFIRLPVSALPCAFPNCTGCPRVHEGEPGYSEAVAAAEKQPCSKGGSADCPCGRIVCFPCNK